MAQVPLAVEAELAAGPCRFVRERLRLPMGLEASFGWLRHPPTVLVVPRLEDGRLLLLRRYRAAVGRWVLEFPSGPLERDEAPGAAAERLVRHFSGLESRGWQELGELRPNPGYSDERMALGMARAEAPLGWSGLPEPLPLDPEGGAPVQLHLCSASALDDTLMALAEAVDGRSVTAWFLARARGSQP